MAYRWVLCPLVRDRAGTRRRPKVALHLDPLNTFLDPDSGLTVTRPYSFSAVAHDTDDAWCLAVVGGRDLTALDTDLEIEHLFESDFASISESLEATGRSLRWGRSTFDRILKRLSDRGVDVSGVTLDTPLGDVLDRAAKHLQPAQDVRVVRSRS